MTLTELHSMRKNLKAGDELIYFAGIDSENPPKKIIFSDYEKHPVAGYSKNLLVAIDSEGNSYCTNYLFKTRQDILEYYNRDLDYEINYRKEQKVKIKNAVKNIK